MQCKKCGQESFADLIEYRGEQLCNECYKKSFEQFHDWDNKRLAVSMEIEDETIILPFAENAEEWDDLPVLKAFSKLKEKWENEKWDYYNKAYDIHLIEVSDEDVKDPDDIVECDEFWGIKAYRELAVESDLYHTPFDENPENAYYSSQFAYDCMYGHKYSKDFAYFHCDECARDICEQKGWHIQYHLIDDSWQMCNKCFEEISLENGINEYFNGDTIVGQFYEYADIENNGWELVEDGVLVGSGYTGYADPNKALNLIQELIDDDKLVLINYESMAIGGMGGYIDIYKKEKSNN